MFASVHPSNSRHRRAIAQAAAALLSGILLAGAATAATPYDCRSAGPFDLTELAASFAARLAQEGLTTTPRSEEVEANVGYIVLAPAQDSPQATRELSRQLREKGVHDQLTMGQGPFSGHIALGVYDGPRSAERRRQALWAKGFDTELRKRTQRVTRWWVNLAYPTVLSARDVTKMAQAAAPDATLLWTDCPSVVTAMR